MASMWCAIFSALLLQVSSYSIDPQQLNDITSSVYRAELPLNCPFHQEPIAVGHLEDTVKGTIKQEGNFAFDKLPGNLLANLDHVNKVNPYLEQIQSSPYYPEFNGNQNQSPFEYQTQAYPSFNNQYGHQTQVQGYPSFNNQNDYQPQIQVSQPYQPYHGYDYFNNGNEMASILPHFENGQNYGNPFNGYDQTEKQTPEYHGFDAKPESPTFSILPHFENGQNYGKPFNGYDQTEKETSEHHEQTPNFNKENSGEPTFSILPYFESDYKYKNPSYVVGLESSENEFGKDDEEDKNDSEQQNDPNKIKQLISRVQANIDAIKEGVDEEIKEVKSNILNKSKSAKLKLEQLKHGKNVNQGPRIESFKRGLFSSFIPKTSRSVLNSATKSVSSGLNLINLPLTTITTLRKEVEAKIPAMSAFTQVTDNLIARSPLNSVAQIIKAPVIPKVEKAIFENSPKIQDLNQVFELKKEEVETLLPKPKISVEDHEESPENKQSESPCLAEAAGINLKIEESYGIAESCIAAADAVATEALNKVQTAVNKLYETAKENHSDKAEYLNMCAPSQFARCKEEEDDLEESKVHFATKTNDELALLTAAEEIHANTVNACEAQASGMLTYLQSVAADSRKNCEDEE